MNNINQSPIAETKSGKSGSILRWILGVMVGLTGLGSLGSKPLLGIFYLVIAAFIIPYTANLFKEKFGKKSAGVSEGATKKCRYCAEQILKEAKVCKFCGRKQPMVLSAKMLYVVLAVVLFVFLNGYYADSSPSVPTAPVHHIQEIQVTEAQCKEALNELYAVDDGKTASPKDPQYLLVQDLLRQYVADQGLGDPNPDKHYTLPSSLCGRTLEGLINVNIEGAKNAQRQ